jgi:hypothetical protein
MSLTVTVKDNETGDTDECQVKDGDYVLVCASPCYLAHTQASGTAASNGSTHVLTVKGRTQP